MPKKIIFCSDGTWDDPNNNSNVCQLYQALETIDGVQMPMYDSGVGTGGCEISKLLGGAVGAGLVDKIKAGYADVAAHYQPGDDIYLFGFSRGAYTARSLAGMIAICGLPTKFQTDGECLDMAWEAYRNVAERSELLEAMKEQFAMDEAKIRLLGVWDTVGSLGIPALFGEVDPIQYGFLSTDLHPNVLNAVQALAIDEQRQQFQPCIWTTPPSDNQSVTQVWFAGVHCDVGGGYTPDNNGSLLSNITLLWMANYAQAEDLIFKPGALPNKNVMPDALATLHNSRTGVYCIFPPHIRNIGVVSPVSVSVAERAADAKLGYKPGNLHFVAGQTGKLADTYNIVNVNDITIG